MLDIAVNAVREALNSYIKIKTNEQRDQIVRFPQIKAPKEMVMESNAVTVLFLNLEEERLFRSGAGKIQRQGTASGFAEFNLNFHLLYISNFNIYTDNLKYLSLVLKFFRSYRTFTAKQLPVLAPTIQQLSTELINLSVMEQSELWRSLDMPCSPSALYKVRLLGVQDHTIEPMPSEATIDELSTNTVIKTIQPVITKQ